MMMHAMDAIEMALHDQLPIIPDDELVNEETSNPRHAMKGIQQHYDIGDDTYCPFEQLTDEQAERIGRELFALGIWYLRHWVRFHDAHTAKNRRASEVKRDAGKPGNPVAR